jgi:hypothetical protein
MANFITVARIMLTCCLLLNYKFWTMQVFGTQINSHKHQAPNNYLMQFTLIFIDFLTISENICQTLWEYGTKKHWHFLKANSKVMGLP